MKFQYLESGPNHERFVMHIGREESELIAQLAKEFYRSIKPIPQATQLRHRAKHIFQAIEDALQPNESASDEIQTS